MPLAHAGHVLVDLLTVLPVFVLIIWFGFITIRDRRRGEDDAGASTARRDSPGNGPDRDLPDRAARRALYLRAVRILARRGLPGAGARSRSRGTRGWP